MPQSKFIYTFNYDVHFGELCKLESRQIFNEEQQNKLLFSDFKIDPSISAFIKTRLEIMTTAGSFTELVTLITNEDIRMNGFNVEYLILDGNTLERAERREKLKDIGYCIYGFPEFNTPTITYAICQYKDFWYFGTLTKHNNDWYKHKVKPHSFSNSIGMNIAKTLVSIASKGDKSKSLLDACCGVGTILLEACCSGFDIEGCDINPKAIKYTKLNLAHYNYNPTVYCSDVKEINKNYDAVIVDLPYNLYSISEQLISEKIIEATSNITARLVIVSIADIESTINHSGFEVIDFCTVVKKGKSTFTRKLWICEKAITS
ncbi:MAG: methyltransferase [Bacteroidia bacterium]|nr:methyltransferase [Bacteroidia bacterium]NNJ55214.1 methyltransferase [Bacteroidia bacterium]